MEFKRNLKKVEEDAFSRGYNACLADTTRKVDEDNHAQAESSIPSTPVVPEAATGGAIPLTFLRQRPRMIPMMKGTTTPLGNKVRQRT